MKGSGIKIAPPSRLGRQLPPLLFLSASSHLSFSTVYLSTPPDTRMSPTSDRPTRDSGPLRRSTSRIGTNLLERDRDIPEPPSVEPLTPCSHDGYLPYDTDDSGRTKSAVQSLLGLLLLLLILDSILRVTDEGEQLDQGLRSTLGQRSVPEQHRTRSFARSLCHNCDHLYRLARL